MSSAQAKQFTFRLSNTLVERVDDCAERIRQSGLSVTRTDVIRLLIKHALETVHCDAKRLILGT